jgi:FkbM family methyltransferase
MALTSVGALPHKTFLWIQNNLTAFVLSLARPITRRHFKRFIQAGDLVFDIGANVGELAQVFSDLQARVIAVEPQRGCVEILRKRFARRPNVTILEMGVSDSVGLLPLHVSKHYHTTSTFSVEHTAESRFRGRFANEDLVTRQLVPTTTLDQLIAEYGLPRFCKIDVEGHESSVLSGLSKRIECVSFEFLSESLGKAEACMQQLAGLGSVRFNVALFVYYRLLSPRWLSAAEMTKRLNRFRALHLSGDIYARFEDAR